MAVRIVLHACSKLPEITHEGTPRKTACHTARKLLKRYPDSLNQRKTEPVDFTLGK